MPITIPNKYNPAIINPPRFGKNALTKKEYIGSFAVQLINGVKRIVILRSRSLVKVLVAITAGTVHPKPISIGTILRQDNPIFRSILSITNATLTMNRMVDMSCS